MDRRARADRTAHTVLKSQPGAATRSRTVLDTRVSADDLVPLVVRCSTNGCCRRILVIAGPSGEGPLTEPTAAARPWRRKPLTLRADARHHARIGILGGEQLVHHAQPRAARAFLVEEPEVAVGPLALAGCGDRIGRIAAGDHVEDRYGVGSRALEQGCAPGGRQRRLSVAIARRFRLTHFEPFVPPSATF